MVNLLEKSTQKITVVFIRQGVLMITATDGNRGQVLHMLGLAWLDGKVVNIGQS